MDELLELELRFNLDTPYTGKVFDPKDPYIPSDEMVAAVNLAMFLGRPLLLRGEPGSGKTRLAKAVYYELNEKSKEKVDYQPWYIKSTSRARDGLYTYDAVRRLHDTQLKEDKEAQKRAANPNEYIKYGPLGKAFKNKDQRTVVLIDEIDKADLDFPNDLLRELGEEKEFEIEELRTTEGSKTTIKANPKKLPIVFITSNEEKALPDAFLRRCVFHYVKFPDETKLAQIVNKHVGQVAETLVESAIRRFIEVRQSLETQPSAPSKKVSTSELIDWVKVLAQISGSDPKRLEGIKKRLDDPSSSLLHKGALLKSWEENSAYDKQLEKKSETR